MLFPRVSIGGTAPELAEHTPRTNAVQTHNAETQVRATQEKSTGAQSLCLRMLRGHVVYTFSARFSILF